MALPILLREGDDAPPTATLKSTTPLHELPQERLERLGPRALHDAELLAMLLRSGTAGENVLSVATRLILDAGSLRNLVEWDREDFQERNGIGPVKALQLLTVMEIARRIREQDKDVEPILDTPAAVYQYFQDILPGIDVEKCWVLCLNTRHRLKRCVELTTGTMQSTLIHPREIFRQVFRFKATAVLIVHNHPGGDPEPSRSDFNATRQIVEAAKVLEVDFVDHIVLGSPEHDRAGQGWFSFRSAGML